MDELKYSIAEASQRLGVSYRTLHYYEKKIGFTINRDGSGNRIYCENDIEMFEKIIELKKKGMTLDGIKTLFQEKGIIPDNNNKIVVIDEKALEMKELLINEIKLAVAEQIKDTNDKIEKLIKENTDLKDEIRKLQRQTEEHFNKIDERFTNWRTKKNKNWIKKIFSK